MDVDIRYLGIVVVILVVFAAGHNYRTSQADVGDFGYCDTDLVCAGSEVAGACIGVEQYETTCFNPETAPEYRDVEARCGALAQNLCANGDYSGTGWAAATNVSGRSCQAWARQDERIDLLSCSQTTPGVQQWDDIR